MPLPLPLTQLVSTRSLLTYRRQMCVWQASLPEHLEVRDFFCVKYSASPGEQRELRRQPDARSNHVETAFHNKLQTSIESIASHLHLMLFF